MVETYNGAKAEALFARLARNGTYVCPTMILRRALTRAGEPSLVADPRLVYVPAPLRADWLSGDSLRLRTQTPQSLHASRRRSALDLRMVGAMQRAGVALLAGTDEPNPFVLPGFSLHDELALMTEAGLTPREALQTATVNPARYLGREGELGAVAVGYLADIVVLNADPLLDVRHTTRIRAVVAAGRLFDRAALDALLAEAARAAEN